MRSLADYIEKQIKAMLEEAEDNMIQLQRRMLANRFGCVPSQINYVLKTRFTPERGYVVDSQRGGHGYIRIVKVDVYAGESLAKYVSELSSYGMDVDEARNLLILLEKEGVISVRERLILEHVCTILWEAVSAFEEGKKEEEFGVWVGKLLTPFIRGEVGGETNDMSEVSQERSYRSYYQNNKW